jgi:tetratricopeptide (TPR) repeat protein
MIRKNIGKLFTAIFCLTGDASWRNSIGRPMKRRSSLAWLFILPFLYSCAGGEMATGRQALIRNQPDVALPYFQHVAETDPNYVMHFVIFNQGVWTYLGRAQYLTGKLPEARQSLERAVSQDNDDYLARLYLGLTLARSGDGSVGLKDIESGMKGIYDRIEFVVNHKIGTGDFWDPRKEIRSEIQSNLAMIAGKEIDWPKLISSGEWVGQKMEEEIDQARWDWQNDFLADPGV